MLSLGDELAGAGGRVSVRMAARRCYWRDVAARGTVCARASGCGVSVQMLSFGQYARLLRFAA